MYSEVYATQYFYMPSHLISVDLIADFSQGLVPCSSKFDVTAFWKALLVSTAYEPGLLCFSILKSPK